MTTGLPSQYVVKGNPVRDSRERAETKRDLHAKALSEARCPVAAKALELVQEALTKTLPDPVRVRLESYVLQLGDMHYGGQDLTEESARELTAYIAEHTSH